MPIFRQYSFWILCIRELSYSIFFSLSRCRFTISPKTYPTMRYYIRAPSWIYPYNEWRCIQLPEQPCLSLISYIETKCLINPVSDMFDKTRLESVIETTSNHPIHKNQHNRNYSSRLMLSTSKHTFPKAWKLRRVLCNGFFESKQQVNSMEFKMK